MWVVDSRTVNEALRSSRELKSLIAQEKLKPKEKLIIVLNKM